MSEINVMLDAGAVAELFGNSVIVWMSALVGLWFALSLLLVMLNLGAPTTDRVPSEHCAS